MGGDGSSGKGGARPPTKLRRGLKPKGAQRPTSLYSRFPDKEALVGEAPRLTLDETFAAADDASGWRAAYEATLRSMGEALIDRGRCVAFHLAYGASTDTPRALDAVRGFFTACRRRLAATLSTLAEPGEADQIAADALSAIEGATLWLAIDGDETVMHRTLDRLLAEADRLHARHPGQAGPVTQAEPWKARPTYRAGPGDAGRPGGSGSSGHC